MSSSFSPIFLILCSKEPGDLVGLYSLSWVKRKTRIHKVFVSVDDLFSQEQGRRRIQFQWLSCDFLWSQMHSGLSVLVFGLVTTFKKEVPDLTFRVHDNSHLFTTLQPVGLLLSPLALLAPLCLLTRTLIQPGCGKLRLPYRQVASNSSI